MSEPLDDIDLLLARMTPVEPPVDLHHRVMARARLGEAAVPAPAGRTAALYLGCYLLALLGLAFLAFELGVSLNRTGTASLLGVLTADLSLLAEAPDAYLGALIASIPWVGLIAIVLDLGFVALITKLILRAPASRAAGWRGESGV